MFYLIASCLIASGLHFGLVALQRDRNPATLSYHAAKNTVTLTLYRVCHVLLGVLLWLFVRQEFGMDSVVLLAIAAIAVVAEWIQAVVPARGRVDALHTVFATIMAVSMALLGVVATIQFAPNMLVLILCGLISIVVLSLFFMISYPPKQGMWKLQLAGQTLLYLQMFLLIY